MELHRHFANSKIEGDLLVDPTAGNFLKNFCLIFGVFGPANSRLHSSYHDVRPHLMEIHVLPRGVAAAIPLGSFFTRVAPAVVMDLTTGR